MGWSERFGFSNCLNLMHRIVFYVSGKLRPYCVCPLLGQYHIVGFITGTVGMAFYNKLNRFSRLLKPRYIMEKQIVNSLSVDSTITTGLFSGSRDVAL